MNEPRRRGPIARFFIGLWDAMNFTRRLVFNLLFFGLVLLVLAAIGGSHGRPLEKPRFGADESHGIGVRAPSRLSVCGQLAIASGSCN